MGNYRFRLSAMMPNAWFYKLKDMGKPRNQNAAAVNHSVKKKQQLSSTTTTEPSKQKQPPPHYYQHPRKSYYFTRELNPTDKFCDSPSKTHFLDPPRKSSKQKRQGKKTNKSGPKLVTSPVSAGCSCRATIWTNKPDSPPDYSSNSPLDISPDSDPPLYEENRSDRGLVTESFDEMVAWSNSCSCRVNAGDDDDDNTTKDIVIDKDYDKFEGLDGLSDFELPPIVTKVKEADNKKKQRNETTPYRRSTTKIKEKSANGASLTIKVVKEEQIKEKKLRKSTSANSPGVKLRINTPRIASRKMQGHYGKRTNSWSSSSSSSRRSLSESFAIVKSSYDPQKDFRESMVEMIVENNIRASKDLEDLLAIYLSLNSDEYHEIIIKVFKQIWFDLTRITSK